MPSTSLSNYPKYSLNLSKINEEIQNILNASENEFTVVEDDIANLKFTVTHIPTQKIYYIKINNNDIKDSILSNDNNPFITIFTSVTKNAVNKSSYSNPLIAAPSDDYYFPNTYGPCPCNELLSGNIGPSLAPCTSNSPIACCTQANANLCNEACENDPTCKAYYLSDTFATPSVSMNIPLQMQGLNSLTAAPAIAILSQDNLNLGNTIHHIVDMPKNFTASQKSIKSEGIHIIKNENIIQKNSVFPPVTSVIDSKTNNLNDNNKVNVTNTSPEFITTNNNLINICKYVTSKLIGLNPSFILNSASTNN